VMLIIARSRSVPMELHPLTAAVCLALSMALAIVSGLAAMRSLRRADPASLLR
jgi:putative ABC transport system permease protein